jgi:thiamine-phosphate pyrophosphorylase
MCASAKLEAVTATSDQARARRERLRDARLYLICDSLPGGRDLRELLPPAIAGGVDIVQLRDKLLAADELTSIAREASALCRRLGALFIVNDRPEIALAAGADGVHVGQQDMSVEQTRELLGEAMLVGLSTHAPAEIDAAQRGTAARHPGSHAARDNLARVDYIGVGPVYSTPTKPGRPATGLDLVRYAAAHSRLPFFAIGGIHAGNATAVLAAGARRLAVVRAIAEAPEPVRAARELRAALEGVDARSCVRTPAA